MPIYNSRYNSENLFFKGGKRVYKTKDYISDAKHILDVPKKLEWHDMAKQHLSFEDKEVLFEIENRDILGSCCKKVEISDGKFQIGKIIKNTKR